MGTSIIITLILALAGVISAFFFGYLPRIRGGKIEALNNKISALSLDLQFFHELENLLLEEIGRTAGQEKPSKKQYRDKIFEKLKRPLSTNQEPRRLRENIINS